MCGLSVGKVSFQVLVDQSHLEICLYRAVQGHTIGDADSTPEERGFQPIDPDALPRCYHNTKESDLWGPTGILKKGIIPGGHSGYQRGATSVGKDGVFCSPIDPQSRFENPLNFLPYNYHFDTTISINYVRARNGFGIQFDISVSGKIMVFQTIPPECLDFAFNVHTCETCWSSDADDRSENRKAAANQRARLESIDDNTIKRIDVDEEGNASVGGDSSQIKQATDENGVRRPECELPEENKRRMKRRLVTSDGTVAINVWGRAAYTWD